MGKNTEEIINGLSEGKKRLIEIGSLLIDLEEQKKNKTENDVNKIQEEIKKLEKEKIRILGKKEDDDDKIIIPSNAIYFSGKNNKDIENPSPKLEGADFAIFNINGDEAEYAYVGQAKNENWFEQVATIGNPIDENLNNFKYIKTIAKGRVKKENGKWIVVKPAKILFSNTDSKMDIQTENLNDKTNVDTPEASEQSITTEEINAEHEAENNIESSLLSKEKIREYQALKEEDRKADIKLAELLELINQLPDDEEEENEEPQKTEGEEKDEEKNEKPVENSETKIDEIEKNLTYKKITQEDFSWSFPNYVDRFGEFELKNKLSITVEEFTREKKERSNLSRILLNSSKYKYVKLKKPYYELKITQEGFTTTYKLDNINQAMNKTDELLSGYARKTADILGEVPYVPFEYVWGSEKIDNNIQYYIKENILSEINKDREEKKFLYYAIEKSNNSTILNVLKNENTGVLDLRKLGRDWVGLKRKHLFTTTENEGFFEYNIFGFAKIIKNVKEIQTENGLASESDKAIYKIIGPNDEIIADNIQGYDEATKIYWDKTNELKRVVEEEFNKLNNK